MKRISFLNFFIFMILLVAHVNGQNLSVGIVGGINFADMKATLSDINRDTEGRTKFGVGIVCTYNFDENFSVQVEPSYLQKGGKIIQDNPQPDVEVSANYIEIPFLFKASLGEKINPFVVAGPTIEMLLSATGEGQANNLTLETDLKPVIKTISFGLTFGAGVGIKVWSGTLFIEGRYCFDLGNQAKTGTIEWKVGNTVVSVDDLDVAETNYKNKSIQIMLGYVLPIF